MTWLLVLALGTSAALAARVPSTLNDSVDGADDGILFLDLTMLQVCATTSPCTATRL